VGSQAQRRLACEEAAALTNTDRDRNEMLVAVDDTLVGWGSISQLGSEPSVELTLLVEDAYQGRGIGRRLLQALIEAARARGYAFMMADLLPGNVRMLRLLESTGLPLVDDMYFGRWRVVMVLNPCEWYPVRQCIPVSY
jgi:GNAT superfamily N-acetyltransferase